MAVGDSRNLPPGRIWNRDARGDIFHHRIIVFSLWTMYSGSTPHMMRRWTVAVGDSQNLLPHPYGIRMREHDFLCVGSLDVFLFFFLLGTA